MIKLIELTFNGDFSSGFVVFLRIPKQNLNKDFRVSPNPQIRELYQNWKNSYEALTEGRITPKSHPDDDNTNFSIKELIEKCNRLAIDLSNSFNDWLESKEFLKIQEYISSYINNTVDDDEVRIFLISDNDIVQRLPWNSWIFFETVPNVEFILSANQTYKSSDKTSKQSRVNNILVIFGNDQGINISDDRKTIEDLSKEGSSNVRIGFLEQPSPEQLNKKLGEQQWDILLFIGHSGTKSGEGIMHLNGEDTIRIKNLKTALRRAIRNGLKLAIFNSCDGLDLAKGILALNIPQVVVMREPVPDKVAGKFLGHFLETLAEGKSLYSAVHHARGQLEEIENRVPCASWLPMIYQKNSTVPSYVWKKAGFFDLIKEWLLSLFTPFTRSKKIIVGLIVVALLVITISNLLPDSKSNLLSDLKNSPTGTIQSSPTPQPSTTPTDVKDGVSSGERILITEKIIDKQTDKELAPKRKAGLKEKQEGVEAFAKRNLNEKNDGAIAKFDSSLGKNPTDPEARIYLNNAIAEKEGQYLTIAVSVPISGTDTLGVAEEILRGVAQAQDEVNNKKNKEYKTINGKLLKVVIADDENKPESVKVIAQNFVGNTAILAVVGHNSTAASFAAMEIYHNKLLAISPTSNGDDLSQQIGKKYYRTLPNISLDVDVLAKYAIKQGWKKVLVCSANDSSNQSFKKGVDEKAKIEIEENHCDLPSQSDKEIKKPDIEKVISSSKDDALLLLPSINNLQAAIDVAKINSRLRSLRPLPLLGNSALYTAITINKGQSSVEGMVLPAIWHPDFDSDTQKFAEKAEKLWGGKVNWRTATSYDAMQVIIAGLKANPNQRDLLEFVSNKDLNVPSGSGIKSKLLDSDTEKTLDDSSRANIENSIRFEKKGDRNAPIKLVKIVNGTKDRLQNPFIGEFQKLE